APGGAVEVLGVTPDLAAYAKAMASGWPAAAVARSANIMDALGNDAVFHAGTYAGNAPAMAAVVATMEILADGQGHKRVAALDERLMNGLVDAAAEVRLDVGTTGYPAHFELRLDGRSYGDPVYVELQSALQAEGVWCDPPEWLISAAHGDTEVDLAIA